MARYAADTAVSQDRSITEIRATLRRYGADGFMFGEEGTRGMVGFRMAGRQVRIVVPLPDPEDDEFTHTETGRLRTASSAAGAYEQAVKQRWRALALVVKAKLEAVESGIATFDSEWLAYLVMPDGLTVGDHALPAVALAYESGKMPVRLLTG